MKDSNTFIKLWNDFCELFTLMGASISEMFGNFQVWLSGFDAAVFLPEHWPLMLMLVAVVAKSFIDE